MEYFNQMKEFCDNIKIKFTEDMYKKFELYMELLIEYNKNVNLTSITNRNEIINRHFLDSISVLIYNIKLNSSICDVGTGAGFPGLPLKIIRDDIKLDLIEATTKKTRFLDIVIKKLDLKNVNIINDRAEKISHNNLYRGKYDYVVSRAMARLNRLLEISFSLVKNSGTYIVLKGIKANEELEESFKYIDVLGGKFSKMINVPNFNSNIIIINKIKNTPSIYPRDYKIILKNNI